MKKMLCSLLMLSSFLSAGTFEEDHKEEIAKIIINAKKKWPDDYFMQKHVIQTEIEDFKTVLEFEKKYGVK